MGISFYSGAAYFPKIMNREGSAMPMRRFRRERDKWKAGLKMRWAFGGPERVPIVYGGTEPVPIVYGGTEPSPIVFGGTEPVPIVFGGTEPSPIPFGAIPSFPPVDIYEEEGNLLIIADIPGFSKEDVKVQVRGKQLILSGERKGKEEVKEEQYYRFERYFDTFYRTIDLPMEVEADKAKAKFKEGTLEITVPIAGGETKEIPVEG